MASPLHYSAYATGGTENTGLLTEQALPLSEESLFRQQAFASSCGSSCCLAVALLKEVDTTGASCLVLPRTLTKKSHSFLCLLRAAQLPSQGCVSSPLLLVQCCCLHRSATSATVVFRGGEPAHRFTIACAVARCAPLCNCAVQILGWVGLPS